MSLSKNIGLKLSNSNLVTFLDDDVQIKKNYFLNSYNFFKKKKCDLLFSQVYKLNKNKPFLFNSIKKDTNINYFNSSTCLSTTLWINKKSLESLFFDTKFGLGALYGSAEETDFIFRAINKKKKNILHVNSRRLPS